MPRRQFLQLLGAGLTAASAGACARAPTGTIVPYARRPPEVTPGLPLSYATAMTVDGHATGLLVQSREGRPIKVEGNPDHPASLGAAGVFEQASVLDLYDPGRARGIRHGDRPATWGEVAQTFGSERPDRGERLRLLLPPTSSPLRAHWLDRVRERHPQARIYFDAPTYDPAPFRAAEATFGRRVVPQYDFRKASVVVAFGADFLATGPGHLRHAREVADGRRLTTSRDAMSRLYVAETAPTPTGTFADHRLAVRSGDIPRLVSALLHAIGRADVPAPDGLGDAAEAWVRAAAADLLAARGRSVVLAGFGHPIETHALVAALNGLLGNEGETVWYIESPVVEAGAATHDIRGLVGELTAGAVDTIAIFEVNPAYSAPGDVDLAALLGRVPTTLYFGTHDDETASLCQWFVGGTHYLETWADTRAWDGTVSLVQPLVGPLYDGRTSDEGLALLAGTPQEDAHALLRDLWRERMGGPSRAAARPGAQPTPGPVAPPTLEAWERTWQEALQRGVVAGTAAARMAVSADVRAASALAAAADQRAAGTIEVIFRPDPRTYDGRFASNAWLLELPDPITKLTWDDAALMSSATAARGGFESEDLVELDAGAGRRLEMPAFVVPGHADDAITLRLGWGRRRGAGVGIGAGTDVAPLRTAASPFATTVTIRRLGGHTPLASTQRHWSVEHRPVALQRSLEDYRRDPEFTAPQRGSVATLYDPPPQAPHTEQWAMTIDLGACTGCSACVIACQAENNVPVVGREGVRQGREMHWLRIDRYLVDDDAAARLIHQPMLCQHCEKAPCEYVCPVNATVHSADGLNEMIYNRCVGTRFCSNNCPYKVRRFNWFDYHADLEEPLSLVLNPDVTVRERGVMEKCTYCVQRIRRAGIQAVVEDRALRDGDVVTACQQACPTRAITFGSLRDPANAVAVTRQNERRYAVLHDLGTTPRTLYLARITNPSPTYAAPGSGAPPAGIREDAT